MATLFEGMWQGDVDCLPVIKSEQRGVMGVLANPQETVGQTVLFPKRPADSWNSLTYGEKDTLTVAASVLIRKMERELPETELVVHHIEGRGVKGHAHLVLLPSYEPRDGDRMYHPSDRMPFDEFGVAFGALQSRLTISEEVLEAEFAARQEYYRSLIESAT